jgi:glycosyltransferase involved in cell wall biosynthesis
MPREPVPKGGSANAERDRAKPTSHERGLSMTPNPLTTIGIPVRNGAGTIGLVLENVARSKYSLEALEILVGDHGSVDDTRQVVESHRQRLNLSIRDVDAARCPGRSAVRNRILEAARGSIIIFIDADILISDRLVLDHLRHHQRGPGTLVAGSIFGVRLDDQKLEPETVDRFRTTDISVEHEALRAHPLLGDLRETLPYLNATRSPLLENPFAWRAFWSGNLSGYRTELLELGGFDETFVGWGLEDEELAYRYALSGRELAFAREAWAYHVPHPVDRRRNASEAQGNADRFFRKYQNGDIERLHHALISGGSLAPYVRWPDWPDDEEYERQIGEARSVLGARSGSRLGLCMLDEESARRLDLTHCCLPFGDSRIRPFARDGCTFYSLLGMRTAFGRDEIDEVVILVDILMLFPELRVRRVLEEACRVSARVNLLLGPLSRHKRLRDIRRRLNDSIDAVGRDRCRIATT